MLSSDPVTAANVAVTAFAALMVTVQFPVPVQAPLQPENVPPEPGVAVSVTVVPELNDAEHVVGQLIPAGVLAIVPVPVPATVAVSAKVLGEDVNVAVTAAA